MIRARKFRSWVALLMLCLFWAGCGGDSDNQPAAGPLANVPNPSNEFVLKPDVQVLDPTVTVAAITDSNVTLSGDLSGISVGQIIIVNQGDQTFARRVTAINGQVVTTAEVSLTDVFESASIARVEPVPPAILAQLQPNLPGLTIAASSAQGRVTEDQLQGGVTLDFDNVPLKQNGKVVAYLNGRLNVDAAFESELEVHDGVGTVSIDPYAHVRGNLSVRLVANSPIQTSLYLTNAVTIPLQNLGPLPVFGQLQLSLDMRGTAESGTLIGFQIAEETPNRAQMFADYDLSGFLTGLSATFEREWTAGITTPAGSKIQLLGSLCTVNTQVRFLGPSRLRGNNFKFPLMGFSATSGLEKQEDVEGTFVQIIDVFNPAEWDTLFRGSDDEFIRRDVTLVGQRLLRNFDPVPNPPRGSITNTRVTPSGPIKLRVGETLTLSALADLSGSGSASFNTPLVLDWSILTGGLPLVTFENPHGANVVIRAATPGKTLISASYQGVDQLIITSVEVLPAAITGLTISDNNQTFVLGDYGEQVELVRGELALTPLVHLTDGPPFEPPLSDMVWLSSDPDIAEIDRQTGHAILKKPGFVTISAAYGGLTAIREIQVVAPLAGALSISPAPPAQLTPGQTLQMNALVSFNDGSRRRITDGDLRWSTTPATVLSVTSSGLVTGHQRGVAFLLAIFEGAVGAARFNVGQQPVIALQAIPGQLTLAESRTQAFEIFATFADGTFAEVSQGGQVGFFVPGGSGIAVDPATSVVQGLFPGTFELNVSYGGKSLLVPVTVTGPQLLAITGQPTAPVAPGASFPLTVQLQDLSGNPRSTDVARNVTVTMTTANLTGGRAVIPAGSSAATLNLSIDQPGTYRLQVVAEGTNSVQSADIIVASAASLGKLLATVRSGGQLIAIAVADLLPTGALSQVAGSPFGAAFPLGRIERLGNFVFAAETDGGSNNVLEMFAFDPASGQLTSRSSLVLFPSLFPQATVMATGRADTLFVATSNQDAATGNQLTALQIDPASGAVLNRADRPLLPQAPLATYFVAGSMAVLQGPSSDLVFVCGTSTRNPILLPKMEQQQVQVFGYNRAVTPPTLTFIGATDVTGAPIDPFFGQFCASAVLVGNRLYVGISFENGAGQINRLDVDPATGGLSNEAVAFDFTFGLSNPSDMLTLTHPVQGPMIFSTGALNAFTIQPNGNLTIVDSTPAGTSEIKLFVDPSDGRQLLTIPGSANNIQTFLVDPVTGATSLLQDNGGFTGARDLAR